ncbi:hypothetical protein H310_12285 [Aphanomyces invadans]|uniref:THH1/TOM1/TOM3 domain-containing protein n=1 Tax=Aphanomyces invadans TaxID=157072 RepID=A0A024TII3_9STRA|nr:hypothetical protein H310_12285 [Aphanomyces invadans]ETV93950.1 hypothetical protein H310_12285 [Aphanomyces invadans]|eukprot:XP_008877510.1 hypothetical protein H310_12285 [Aphanomyces invadans]
MPPSAVWIAIGADEGHANRSAFGATGFVYMCLCGASLVQLIRNCRSYNLWTQQKTIHALLFLLTLLRTGFLIAVGVFNWCDVAGTGALSSTCETRGFERQVFYIVDQLPNMLFLSMYVLISMFWAEIYYNATDQLDIFTHVIKPVSRVVHVAAYLLQIGLWVLYADPWRSENHYFGRGYAAFSATFFALVSVAFLVYARLAFVELRAVPVDLPIRSKKLREVTLLTTVCFTCFTSRCLLVLVLAHEHVQLQDHFTWLMIVLFYSIFELVPIVALLHFHRRFPTVPSAALSSSNSPLRPAPHKAPYRFIADAIMDDDDESDSDLSADESLRQTLLSSP